MKETREHLVAKTTTQQQLKYLLYQPENVSNADSGIPLVLFLHGMGERGDDLTMLKRNGLPARIEGGAEFPFVLAAPQCPLGAVWQNDILIALLDELSERLDIDRKRIYLTGLSMGGAGTWALANVRPQRFAAIAPICGPFTMIDPENFKTLPVWCFHGALDGAVPITHSIELVKLLRGHGAEVRFTVYPDAAHDSWTQAYAGNQLGDWLLSHKRA